MVRSTWARLGQVWVVFTSAQLDSQIIAFGADHSIDSPTAVNHQKVHQSYTAITAFSVSRGSQDSSSFLV